MKTIKVKCDCPGSEENIAEKYARQAMENHAFLIDKNFWMVVKQKPSWIPLWLYRAVIKELIEFQIHKNL